MKISPQKSHTGCLIFAAATVLMALGPTSGRASDEQAVRDLDAVGSPIRSSPVDPDIEQALRQISASRIRHTIETLVGFHTRNTLSSMAKDLPAGQGIGAAASWIESELERYSAACGNCLEVKRDTFTESPQRRIPAPTTITNVYAVLRGSDPAHARRAYLVTGHYDSRVTDVLDTEAAAPGANDDASGVAVSLECARVLSRLRPRATIVFAAVAGEEQGLNGSRHLAKLASAEGWQLAGVLNNDIVGGNTTAGDTLQDKSAVRVFSEGLPAAATPEQEELLVSLGYENDSPSRQLARALLEISETYQASGSSAGTDGTLGGFHPTMIFRRDRFLRSGDHTSFNKEGVAAVRLTEWREDFNHQHQNVRIENGVQYGDLPEFVDFQYVARVAALNAATLATLAYAPAPPVNVRVLASELGNGTTLQWQGGAGASPDTRYEIVWRETSAPQWQRSLNVQPASATRDATAPDQPKVGARESVKLPVSKDNVIFGVRAVDAQGHRSLAVVPLPLR